MVHRKIWGFLATLLVATLVLAGCAGGNPPAGSSNDAPADTETTAAPAAEGSTAAAPDVTEATADSSTDVATTEAVEPTSADAGATDSEPVKIGLVSPFSGPLGILGQWMQASAEAEVDRINNDGGLLGRQVELITRDDELNPAKAVESVREFVDREQVSLIIGPSLTAFALATKDLINQSEVIQMLPTVSGMAALEDAPYSYRTLESIQLQMTEIGRYLGETGATKVGMVVLDDATGAEYMALLPPAVEANGMEYVGNEMFRADDQDVTTQVLKVREAGADALMIGTGNSALAAKVIAAVGQLGWDVPIVGVSGLESSVMPQLVGDAVDGVVFVNTYRGYQAGIPAEEMPEGYRDHVQAALKLDSIPAPDERDLVNVGMSTSTGDAIYLWAEAVERAGSFDTAAVKAELEKTDASRDETPSAGNLTLTPENHEAYGEGSLFFYQWIKQDDGSFRYETIGS